MTPDPRTLASSPDPLVALVEHATSSAHRADDGAVVVSRPAEVVQVLEHPDAVVAGPAADVGPVADLVGAMARFGEGPGHCVARARIESVVAGIDLDVVRASAAREVREEVSGPDVVDVAPIARRVPAMVLGTALGVVDPPGAVAAVDLLCRRLAPMLGAPQRPADAAVVAALVAAVGPLDDADVVAVVSVLFQAMEATAGLVAQRLLGSGVAPAVLTIRRAEAPMQVGPAEVAAGDQLVVVLAAAAAVGHADLAFGHGRHRCPGRDLAVALADAVVSTVLEAGFRVTAPPTSFEARPNLRIPSALLLARRTGEEGPSSTADRS